MSAFHGKSFLGLAFTSLLLVGAPPPARALAAPDDLLVQTRLNARSSAWLIDNIRLILSNAELGDGLNDTTTLDEDPVVDLGDFSSDPRFIRLRDSISSIFRVKADQAFLRFRIPAISYNIHSLHANPEKLSIEDPLLKLRATAQLQGVDIGLPRGIQIDFMIPDSKTKKNQSYLTANLKPVSVEIPSSLPPAEFQIDLEALRDQTFHLKLAGSELSALPEYVNRNLGSIRTFNTASRQAISADDITINPVTVRINTLSRSIQFDEMKPVVQKYMDSILSSVLRSIGKSLQTSIGPKVLNTIFSKTIPSQFSISTNSIYTRYSIAGFSQPDPDQIQFGLEGGLCTSAQYRQFGEKCQEQSPPETAIRTIPEEDRTRARNELREKIAAGSADVGLSVSEEYLNRLLKTTIDARVWEPMLAKNHLELGPKGIFAVFKNAGSSPELFLDVVYREAKGLARIFVNPKHPIRFPLRMSTSLSFETGTDTPKVSIRIEKLMSDSNEIIHGIPEYQLPSHLVPFFRKKIARMIIEMAGGLEGKDAVSLAIPLLRGVDLQRIWWETSAFGRLHLYFKL